jgi:hypothetical protein
MDFHNNYSSPQRTLRTHNVALNIRVLDSFGLHSVSNLESRGVLVAILSSQIRQSRFGPSTSHLCSSVASSCNDGMSRARMPADG